MSEEGSVLIEYRAAVDYCQPVQEYHEVTNAVLDEMNNFGIQIKIRKACWRKLNDSISNVLNMFTYLRDEATEILKNRSQKNAEIEFTESILTHESLSQENFSLNDEHMPELSVLREAISEVGIRDFRAYADSQVQICQKNQRRLDLMVDRTQKYGSEDPWVFEASVGNIVTTSWDEDFLTDAFVWAKRSGDYLISRCGSEIHSKSTEIQNCMSTQRFQILCPEEIDDYID